MKNNELASARTLAAAEYFEAARSLTWVTSGIFSNLSAYQLLRSKAATLLKAAKNLDRKTTYKHWQRWKKQILEN